MLIILAYVMGIQPSVLGLIARNAPAYGHCYAYSFAAFLIKL